MRNLILPVATAATAILLSSCAMTPAQTARANEAKAASQAALGKELAGLQPVATSDCLDNYRTNPASLAAYGGALVYRVSKNLVYVNQTTGGCEAVERGDILVTRSNSGRLCRGDIGTTVMPSSSGVPTGSCALGSFVTYRR